MPAAADKHRSPSIWRQFVAIYTIVDRQQTAIAEWDSMFVKKRKIIRYSIQQYTSYYSKIDTVVAGVQESKLETQTL